EAVLVDAALGVGEAGAALVLLTDLAEGVAGAGVARAALDAALAVADRGAGGDEAAGAVGAAGVVHDAALAQAVAAVLARARRPAGGVDALERVALGAVAGAGQGGVELGLRDQVEAVRHLVRVERLRGVRRLEVRSIGLRELEDRGAAVLVIDELDRVEPEALEAHLAS